MLIIGSNAKALFANKNSVSGKHNADLTPRINSSGTLKHICPTIIMVMAGYGSGSILGVSSSTYTNSTFASLGMNTGTFVWSWNGDSITLNTLSSVPAPAAAWLFGLGLIGLAGIKCKK